MSRFGWAYVNSLITGAVANGPTNSIQFNSGSQVLSGSSNFTFDPATNTLYLTGTLRADTLIVSSSQILKSGSTIFGDDVSDTHQFTGSIYNTTLVSGTNAQFINITSSNITASTIDISGISVMGGQVRAFGGIQSRNSPITVTNANGTVTHVNLTTAGLVSGTTGQFSVISSSVVSASTYFGISAGTPGADNKAIQFNSGSTFSGSSNLTFDYTTNTLNLTGTLSTSGDTTVGGDITIVGNTIKSSGSIPAIELTGSNVKIYGDLVIGNAYISDFSDTKAIEFGGVGIVSFPSGNVIFSQQARMFGGLQSRNSPITVTNTNGTITHVSLTTDGLVSGTTGQFSVVTSSTITASNLFVSNDATIGANILGSGAFKGGYSTYTGSFTVPTTSYFVGVSSTGSVITASLSNATSYPSGQTLIFKDIGGNAATNNIRVKPSGSQTIDGATSLVISSTSGSATIISNGVDGFYIIGLT